VERDSLVSSQAAEGDGNISGSGRLKSLSDAGHTRTNPRRGGSACSVRGIRRRFADGAKFMKVASVDRKEQYMKRSCAGETLKASLVTGEGHEGCGED
jgi:hypothetical protein